MTRLRRFALLGAIGCLLPLAAPNLAGSAVLQGDPNRKPASLDFAGGADNKAVYEQLEILKRILSQKLMVHATAAYGHSGYGYAPTAPGGVYGPATAQPTPIAFDFYSSGGSGQHSAERRPDIDGFHLPGVGLVFTLSVSKQDSLGRYSPSAAKPADLWEQAAQEFAGAKEEKKETKPTAPEVSLKDQLVEHVLRTLGEYGHRLTSVPDGERVYVVVTLIDAGGHGWRPASSSAYYSGSPVAAAPQGPTIPAGATSGAASSAGAETFGSAVRFAGEQENAASEDVVERHMKLGDLHLKQGRTDDAKAAYDRAAAESRKSRNGKHEAEAYRKLAEVAIVKGDLKDAQMLLDKALTAHENAAKTTASEYRGALKTYYEALQGKPQKLIVSIRMQDIRHATERPDNRVDVEALKRLATVEMVDLPVAKRSMAPPPVTTPAPAAAAPAR